MFKPCPQCGFLVALIAGREASQRCPRCGSVLVTESELLELEAAAPTQDDSAAPRPAGDGLSLEDAQAPASVESPAAPDIAVDAGKAQERDDRTDAARAISSADSVASPAMHEGPSFARRRARVRSARPRWPWAVGLAALSLLLAAQLLLAQRVELAREATWRPLVMRA